MPNRLNSNATEPHPCPVCASQNRRPLFRQANLPLHICTCGLVYLYPQPDDKTLRNLYGSEYYSSWGIGLEEPESTKLMKRSTFSSRMASLPPGTFPGRALDVGCATGAFMEVANESGWETHGVELSEFSSSIARKTFGDRVFCGQLHEAAYPDSHFDLVTLSDLLEHVPDPGTFLDEVRRVLTRKGILLIVTPDIGSLSFRIMGRRWSHFKLEHLWYFSASTLSRLLARHGFSIQYIRPAPKHLNLAYIINQFSVYHHPVLTPICRLLDIITPTWLKTRNTPVLCGEMIVMAAPAADTEQAQNRSL